MAHFTDLKEVQSSIRCGDSKGIMVSVMLLVCDVAGFVTGLGIHSNNLKCLGGGGIVNSYILGLKSDVRTRWGQFFQQKLAVDSVVA